MNSKDFEQDIKALFSSINTEFVKSEVKQWMVYASSNFANLSEGYDENYSEETKDDYLNRFQERLNALSKAYLLVEKTANLEYMNLHKIAEYTCKDDILEKLDFCCESINEYNPNDGEWDDLQSIWSFIDKYRNN